MISLFRSLVLCVAALLATAAIASGDACLTLPAPAGVVFDIPPEWVDAEGLPRYCRVSGTIDKRVKFEMRLPEKWSGRFLMAGCGGFCGSLLPDKPGHSNAINEALKRGYAGISHDSGHQAQSWETHWADDREALELWAYKILPVVAGVGAGLAKSVYGREPSYRYFSGCSNGGRLGLQAAQRYPELFDGIAAGSSIFELSGIAGLWGNWLIANNQAQQASRFPQTKVPVLERFVMERCDALDGLSDGVIDDPRACKPDLDKAVCDANPSDHDACLTAEEAGVLKALYGGVRDSAGELVYPSMVYGSEHYSDIWLFGTAGNPAWGILASAGYRQMLAADLSADDEPAGLSTEQMQDWLRRSSIPALADATNPDLSGLAKAGTKLIVYQGWSDPLIIPEPIIHYYEQAVHSAGGLEQLQRHARLFMVPGWGHCWEKPANAPDDFDPLRALEQWVEAGISPDFIVARGRDATGLEQRSRPVCAFPALARLETGGDPDNYQSYRCVSPSAF